MAGEPVVEQLFIAAAEGVEGEAFERQLYLIRKRAANSLRSDKSLTERKLFYICSLSTKVHHLQGHAHDRAGLQVLSPTCNDPDYTSHLAMVHSRFSTNTFPSWDRAQPCRFMSHNGEINTLRGNANWMFARQGVVKSELFGDELAKLFPIVEPDCSDSGTFDNVLEFLLMSGRTLQESVMMMVPEAWQNHETMPEDKRAFYEYNSCLMEPWDGPASIVFTDGKYIGAVLDRNGLRPSPLLPHARRPRDHGQRSGRAAIDQAGKREGQGPPAAGPHVPRRFRAGPADSRRRAEARFRQAAALRQVAQEAADRSQRPPPRGSSRTDSSERRCSSGCRRSATRSRRCNFMLLAADQAEKDPIGSMGNDSCLACLSDKPRMLYDYFRQLFAQVTNPAIDSIREEVIMSLECYIGPEQNLLETTEKHARRLRMPHPILSNEQMAALKRDQSQRLAYAQDRHHLGPRRRQGGHGQGPRPHMRRGGKGGRRRRDAHRADRSRDQPDRVPLSSLLATGAVHHHLVRAEKRTRVGIIIETGEAREVHHHCLLVGYGADAINPYLAFESLWQARREGLLDSGETGIKGEESGEGDSHPAISSVSNGEVFDPVTAADHELVTKYRTGVAKGMLKVMAKIGISTLQSYKGAQIFEAIGLRDEVINRCFAGTASRIQGVDFDVLAEESLRRHALGYPAHAAVAPLLPNPGEFHWRAEGERHMWDPRRSPTCRSPRAPTAVTRTSGSPTTRTTTRAHAASCAGCSDSRSRPRGSRSRSIRSQSASDIVKRFCTGAMSFGSISAEAHESLAIAMNRIGGKSNTGEGGEDPERFKTLPNGDSKRSAIKQVASGRFGVTINYLTNADELQIKISQGAKPGEGGELPGRKVDDYIAKIRYSTPGVGLISPPPHHDIYSIEDLKQLIHDLKNSNPSARVSVKLVSEVGVGTIAAGVAKGYADHILISGDGGGTGASPLTSIKHAGLPWELGIAETHQTLVMNDLRSRVVLQTDGGIKTGRDVVIAAMLGAEEFGFATAPLITLGCIMMRKCHLNTCPVGVATQDPELRKKFNGKPEYVINYLFLVAEEAREIMARLGFRTIDEMVGRVDCLETNDAIRHWKADGLDLTNILTPAKKPYPEAGTYCTQKQNHGLELSLDMRSLVSLAKPALESGASVREELEIINTDRTVGAILSHEIAKRYGVDLLPDDTIHFKFTGSAGQSFGAFLAKGVTLELEGDANDYVGKGLSGGRVVIYPPRSATFVAGGEHHRRQRVPVRRHQRHGVLPWPCRRAVRRPQQRRPRGDRGRRRPCLRVHDRRPRGRAGPHGPQLRGRHERRRRLRVGARPRRVSAQPEHGHGRTRGCRGRRGYRGAQAAHRDPPERYRQHGRLRHPRPLGRNAAAVRQGDAGRLQACAAGAKENRT